MSSPNKCSTRLSKLEKSQNQKPSDKKPGAKETDSLKTEQSDKMKGIQNGKSRTDVIASAPEISTVQNPSSQNDNSSKKNKLSAVLSTPPTPVRRSGRAPVPSSRYKDMEVTTPGASRKRSLASSSKEPDLVPEHSGKRMKKQSKNTVAELSSNDVQAATTIESTEEDKTSEGNKATALKITKPPQKTTFSPEGKTVLLEMSEEETYGVPEPETKPQDDPPKKDENVPVTLDNTETDEERNVPISVEEMIEKSLQEGKIDKSDLEASSSAKRKESRESLESKSNEYELDASHIDLDNKPTGDLTASDPDNEITEDLAVSDANNKTTDDFAFSDSDHKTTEDLATSNSDNKTTASEIHDSESVPTPSITIGGQNVTFEERNGETVAVVTIASGLGDSHDQTVLVPEEGAANDHPLTEIVSVIPNSHGGHTVVTGKTEDSAAVVGPQKLTIEARQFSSLLKPKPRTSNPVTGHGRVIPKNEQQMTAMMFKSGVGSPSLTPAGSYVAVSSPQDMQPQKSGKKYSLLPPLSQTSIPETSRPPSHGSVTSKSSPKVIIVNQKSSDGTGAAHISTLKSPAQVTMPATNNSSTLIHVKKAQGTSLTASDLECVLKALSGKNVPETEPTLAAEESFSVGITEEASATANGDHLESAESKEDNPPISTEVDKVESGDFGQVQEEKKLEKDEENLAQDTTTVDNKNETDKDGADEVREKVEEETRGNKSADATNNKEISSEPAKTVTEAFIEEASSENLPVESALYQALQALEPTAITSMQTPSPENGENAANLELPVAKKVEGEDSKSSSSDKWTVKGETIKVVDNGIEYDVRIVCQEDVTEEIIDDSAEQDRVDKADEISVKEEALDESIDEESGMQTSGTQTLYSDKASHIQRMATVVDKDGQKKQVYYVSVFPGKGVLNRVKSNQGARLTQASWVLSENGLYCCGKCDYKTDKKANFYKHRRLHIGAKPHICPICQYKAGTSSNLKRHMGIHKDIREHKCEICGLCFRQKIHLERHIKYKHEVKSVKCPLCDYVCANEQPDLKMHMKRKHSNGKSGEMLKCPECNVEVGSKKDLKQHMKFHKDGPELKLFCKECSFVTDCQSRLRRHQAIHSKLKPFQCGVCPYRAAQKEHVLRHLRTQHKIEVKREVKKTWRSKKQPDQEEVKVDKADFTSGDKIFACNHCTMRFAKLINLYKHLHTQHSDIMPPETSGNYYCVVCEFSTTTKKNLLVHMRRHNMTDQTPPTHVYSCVLCRYVNPKRRNLFQHMRKKHNIDISNQAEDEAETQVLEMGEMIKSVKDEVLTTQVASTSVTGVVGTGEALTTVEIHENNNSTELGNLANMIKIEDLTRTGTTPPADGDDNTATLVIDTRATESTPVQIVHATNVSSLVQEQQHSVDALEGLQALAEQAGLVDSIIEEQVTSLEQNQQQETMIIDQVHSTEEGANSTATTTTTDAVEIVNDSEHLQELQGVTLGADGEVEIGAGADFGGMELSEEQLSNLRHGDMVEMDGELYVVEMTNDPDQPDKQILSFVPVSATEITDQE
ncbi:transcriptional repressor CTCF [Elysia marginata]|uniref:Transcriptional repressor CTCF n=1 Tax=Elysia marginata TaxID=1093978 RepID=A0AAV4EC01_9GAST|nr:transcriptional repressor CTCF [Elysia marginata]